jgi:hypothetical protein
MLYVGVEGAPPQIDRARNPRTSSMPGIASPTQFPLSASGCSSSRGRTLTSSLESSAIRRFAGPIRAERLYRLRPIDGKLISPQPR